MVRKRPQVLVNFEREWQQSIEHEITSNNKEYIVEKSRYGSHAESHISKSHQDIQTDTNDCNKYRN
jgi:hypothetical protein